MDSHSDVQHQFWPRRAPLIGRDSTLARLTELFTTVRAGNPMVVLLSGPPGIGKSRLLDEFPGQQQPPYTLLRGGASQAVGMPPYLPFIEALGDYFAAADPEQLKQIVGESGSALVPIFPELVHRLDTDELHPLGPEQQRFRLFEAVTRTLAALAREAPLIVQLDDLQWVDPATLDLLVHVTSRLQREPILIMGAYRDGDHGPALSSALTELNRSRRLVSIALEPLDDASSAQLLERLLRGSATSELSETLCRLAEGNPFFLEEYVRAHAEAGTLTSTGDGWTLAGAPAEAVPPRIAEAIQGRLDRLEPRVVETLRLSAVAGRSFWPAIVARALGAQPDTVEADLLLAQRAQLVRAAPDGRLMFSHDLIRETLMRDLGAGRLQHVHQALAEALEVERADDAARDLADLTFHFAAAADSERGARYSLESARQSMRSSAPQTAMTHYDTALRLAPGPDQTELRIEALMGLGAAATQAGVFTQAIGAYRRACDEAMRIGDRVAAARAWIELGRVFWRQEAIEQARQALQQAIELLESDDGPAKAEALIVLADLEATSFGQIRDGIALATQAQAIVERGADRRLTVRTLMTLGNVKARSGDEAAGRSDLERALAIGQELDDASLIAEIAGNLSTVYAWMGDLEGSRRLSQLRADAALRAHDVYELRHAYGWIGIQYMLQGHWDDAWQAFQRQEAYVDAVQSAEPLATLCAYRARYHYLLGEFDQGLEQFERAIELVDAGNSSVRIWFSGIGALILAEIGEDARALALLAELERAGDAVDPVAPMQRYVLAHCVLGYTRLGMRAEAAACYDALLPFRGTLTPVLTDRVLGLAAWSAGKIDAADQHFAEGVEVARAVGLRPELALALLNRAALPDAQTRTSSSAELRSEGLRLAEELGMTALGARALQPLGTRARPASQRPAGLTARETEVIRLISQGLTNRQIADQLFISEKTVARHLTTIYAKTGVDNRAGAAAFALRAGIA